MAAIQKVKHAKARALVNTQHFDFFVLKQSRLEWEQITFGDDRDVRSDVCVSFENIGFIKPLCVCGSYIGKMPKLILLLRLWVTLHNSQQNTNPDDVITSQITYISVIIISWPQILFLLLCMIFLKKLY